MKQVPYRTRTGIEIGSNYHPDRRPPICDDMELIQSVLLGSYQSPVQRYMGFIAYMTVIACTVWAAVVFAR